MGCLTPPHLLTALLFAASAGLCRGDWSYEGDGPAHWSGVCQHGQLQSPVDLGSSGITESDFEALSLINYNFDFNGTITNNGHTVQFQIVDRPHNIMLTGGGLNKVYSLEQIHFHWPSEHTIMGDSYPLEVHFVHFEKKLMKISDAVKTKGGIAVLAVMFRETDSPGYDIPVLSETRDIKFNSRKNIVFSPSNLLPTDTTKFYRYYGSLTTPGCDESVVWTVFANSRPLSGTQISYFQKIKDEKGKLLLANNRPIQDQNDRIIYFQSSPPKQVQWVNAAQSFHCSLTLMAVLLIMLKHI